MGKIKVGIDISPLKNANRFRGVGFYTKNLVESLQSLIKENKKYSNWQISLIENWKLEIGNFDLFHYPYFDIFFPTLPKKKNIPTVVTVHDLTPLVFPEHYPAGVRGKINWLRQKRNLKKTEAIITDSQKSKQDIVKIVGYPEKRVHVVYLAPSFDPKKFKTENLKLKIKQKYHLPDNFVLYVGDVNWNKNIPGLVKACRKIGIPLVIVGKQAVSKDYDQTHPENQGLVWLQREAEKSKLLKRDHSKSLLLLGFVEEEDLAALYNLATLYCQPSFYEGFGMPVLEAMAGGCPVVCSNQGSLPEIGGQAVAYFDPYKKGNLEKVLKKVWEDKNLRQELAQKGLAQAKKFSWPKCAQETLNVYQGIINHEKTF